MAFCALALILANWDSLLSFGLENWAGLVLWGAILLLLNLFPVHVAEMTLTLDMPILLAIAILYPPEVAAVVALVANLDVREFSGQLSPTRATFNRAQIVVSVFLAGVAFRVLAPHWDSWLPAFGGIALSLFTFHVVNVLLVSLYTVLRLQRPIRLVLSEMVVGDWREFLPTYLAFGSLALILAFVYVGLGGWSVVLFIAPLLVARQAFVREQRLHRLAQRLAERERLLERLFDRMGDEREDERSRIAFALHDDVLPPLIRLSQLGGFLREQLASFSEVSGDLDELVSLSQSAGDNVRQVVRDLGLSGVGRGGLIDTLSGLVRDLELRSRTPIDLNILVRSSLPPAVELCAYQIAKEALGNSVRHSKASRILVSLTEDEGGIHLTVADDGVGFHVERVDRTSHFGLGLLEARARLAGGSIQVDAFPGRGTKVDANLPLEKTRPEEPSFNFSGLE